MHLLKPFNTLSATDYGRGYGFGYGNGYGFGYGNGYGDGYGCGLGDGYGCGFGNASDYGNGIGGSTFTQDTNALLILLAVQKHVEGCMHA